MDRVTAAAHSGFPWVGFAFAAFAMVHSIIAYVAMSRRIRSSRFTTKDLHRPVTILKPLCGAEPETYECLRSFCDQAYPEFQVIFGVSDSTDPALAIVDRLQREFPQLDLAVAIDRRQHGSNRKVSNLINMMPLARHEYLVLSESGVGGARGY